MPQHSAPRASSVPARMKRRPCGTRSSIGPMSGASTANGAMVTSRAIATWLRAWLTEALKNRVPASATATKASPTLLAAVSSMRLDSPVRLAPEAPVIRWTTRPAPRLAEAPALALDWAADVSEPLGVEADGERVGTHLFTCLDPGYRGWRWAVTVARASRSRIVTVSECLLVPGPDAILAPPWVPWRERVRPGDLGAGDILPAAPDDERLVPTAVLEGDDGVEDLTTIASQLASLAESAVAASAAAEMSVSCVRVLSAIGRDEAAPRWYTGEPGPRGPPAHLAPGPGLTSRFLCRLGRP